MVLNSQKKMRLDVKASMDRHGVSRESVVERGFSEVVLDKLESGNFVALRMSTYCALCDAIGCEPCELPVFAEGDRSLP